VSEPSAGERSDEPVLPEQTLDDTDHGWGDAREAADEAGRGGAALRDEDYLRDRPPHWE